MHRSNWEIFLPQKLQVHYLGHWTYPTSGFLKDFFHNFLSPSTSQNTKANFNFCSTPQSVTSRFKNSKTKPIRLFIDFLILTDNLIWQWFVNICTGQILSIFCCFCNVDDSQIFSLINFCLHLETNFKSQVAWSLFIKKLLR